MKTTDQGQTEDAEKDLLAFKAAVRAERRRKRRMLNLRGHKGKRNARPSAGKRGR